MLACPPQRACSRCSVAPRHGGDARPCGRLHCTAVASRPTRAAACAGRASRTRSRSPASHACMRDCRVGSEEHEVAGVLEVLRSSMFVVCSVVRKAKPFVSRSLVTDAECVARQGDPQRHRGDLRRHRETDHGDEAENVQDHRQSFDCGSRHLAVPCSLLIRHTKRAARPNPTLQGW